MLAIDRSWGSWRGRAVEPVIREALLRIGGKTSERHAPVAFAGSIEWHETRGFGGREYADLVRDVRSVPGTNDQTTLLAVTGTGTVADEVPIRCLGPDAVLTAWRG